MKTKNNLAAAALALTLAAFAGTAAAAPDLWLHVKVDDTGEKVTVNLPLSMIEKALPMIPEDAMEATKVVFDETEMTIEDLRQLWNDIKDQPDFTMVTVEGEGENVNVRKEGNYLLVNVREDGDTQVDVRVPLTVVDALLSGQGEQLDMKGALQALAAHGEGELVTVNEDEETVRVWIDSQSESR